MHRDRRNASHDNHRPYPPMLTSRARVTYCHHGGGFYYSAEGVRLDPALVSSFCSGKCDDWYTAGERFIKKRR